MVRNEFNKELFEEINNYRSQIFACNREIKEGEYLIERAKERIKNLRKKIKEVKSKKICDVDVEFSINFLTTISKKSNDENYSRDFVFSFEQILITLAKFFDKDKFFSLINRDEYSEEQIENFEFLVDLIEKYKI